MVQFRTKVKALLEECAENVYFQPPKNIQMSYPCIVWEIDDMPAEFGNNNPYRVTPVYMVTVIDRDPDSEIVEKVSRLPKCGFYRHFKADNLNHTAFTIYF